MEIAATSAGRNSGRTQSVRHLALLVMLLIGISPLSADSRLQGQLAPDFVLKGMNGENLRLSEFLGEVVLLNFWATWCGSCRQEMPELETLYETYRSAGFVLIGVSVDDDTQRAIKFVRALAVDYPILLDPRKSVAPLYRLDELPMTVLIDRAGTVRFVHADYQAGKEQPYLAELKALLNE